MPDGDRRHLYGPGLLGSRFEPDQQRIKADVAPKMNRNSLAWGTQQVSICDMEKQTIAIENGHL